SEESPPAGRTPDLCLLNPAAFRHFAHRPHIKRAFFSLLRAPVKPTRQTLRLETPSPPPPPLFVSLRTRPRHTAPSTPSRTETAFKVHSRCSGAIAIFNPIASTPATRAR